VTLFVAGWVPFDAVGVLWGKSPVVSVAVGSDPLPSVVNDVGIVVYWPGTV
jgi:hypothetical protein